MGHTRKRNYDRYTLAYKQQAVRLASHPDVKSKDVADSLGIHPVMLYRWQMEHRKGELRENKYMKPAKPTPKRRPDRADPAQEKEDQLKVAHKRIQQLEKQLANREDELDLLKKAERFFTKIS
ncbi:transposase [Haliea salexigens]|uniref:transposase n=1 Tax=Haliea salexigens TaxID=287487 RepID=UPI000556A2F0|nr:transposase [Haliea salexigens]